MPYIRDPSGHVFETDNPHFHPDCVRLSAKEGRAAYVAQSKAELRQLAPTGATIYCVLRDVSRSGMSRRISFYVIQDNRPRCIDYLIEVLGTGGAKRHGNKDGLVVPGCGMDMGFHVVYSLARSLHSDAPGSGDAGYALQHSWL